MAGTVTTPLQSSLGTSNRPLLGPARLVLVPAIVVVIAAGLGARFSTDVATKRVFDNIHWTTGYGAAAVLAFLGARASSPEERGPRLWFAWALLLYFVGQVLWDIQVAVGWNPFPGPSDLFYLLLGPLSGVGLLALFKRRASVAQRVSLDLDVATLSAAVLALALALYLPKQGTTGMLQMAVMVAYPVVLGWAACVGLIFALTLRLRPHRSWVMFISGLLVNGALWLQWNALTLDNELADGTLYNLAFSVTALVQGTGALLWQAEESSSRRWQRLCDGALRSLPLIGVVLSAAAVTFAYTLPGVPPAVKGAALVGALVVVLLASVRQAVLLRERDRLIEERARAELLIRESEERYRTLVEQAADGIFIADSNGVYLEVNPRGAEMLGMSREEIIGLSIADVVTEQEVKTLPGALDELHSGSNVRREYLFKRKDGTTFWGEVSGKMLADGRLQGLVRDISDRKRAEQEREALETQLVQSQKMQAVGSLAAGIAHDFNNMLSAIRGNADLATLDLEDGHPARVSVEEISKAGRRAAQLVEQIVAFSRPSKPSSQSVRLPPIVDEVVRLLRSTLPAAVEMRTSYAADAPPVVGDPTQIHQVLVNLCTNAWQAMDDRPGMIQIAVERAPKPPATLELGPGEYVAISVGDNGGGMDAATRDRIFEPFFTTKGVGKGTGLGLSVVHNIVKSHHGAITVESSVGQGTTFRIYLPASGAAAASSPTVKVQPVSARERRRVLYVDDDEALVFLMKRQLEHHGHQVQSFSSPLEALAAIERHPHDFDILVTDYNMPKLSGLKLLEAARKLRSDLPVILTSGFISDEMRAAAERAGATFLIHKPDTDDELCDAIDRAAAVLP
ncbi:MAG TPA: PAS domain S-box protein [Polyangiaceae bacterium]|nr:PAS domain S-box protein [Polyangiaceae bacterium]